MGWRKIKFSVENVITAGREVGEVLADPAGIINRGRNALDWESVADYATREFDWTEVTDQLEIFKERLEVLMEEALMGAHKMRSIKLGRS
ncbi:hypothetical protein E8L90_05395 [Brevibacillus antibioticus]|uniref:Uncharacterized protein n=1 Tax=Brevibacillus antibioticus TaxID=2570228 RepID=A0A4U2Y399_9BACL|nr:hypothetical protein [Brevibacillus antibioticus]TKI54926.1 hypothetical protein E8L90_05395 [Brevibacillus antibioticus]